MALINEFARGWFLSYDYMHNENQSHFLCYDIQLHIYENLRYINIQKFM
jgi:hypothetical protein